jgi:DNA invertase Pin-like site-specific DNA recombinase
MSSTANPTRYVAYYRVSTARQGESGLGLEAQRHAVTAFLNDGDWTLAAEFTEVESGKHADRPQLQAALDACRRTGARLVIAKLDRLSRDAHFLLGLQKAGVDFVCADMPEANRLTIGLLAVVAQHEREQISARTKAALAAAKARGVKLGGRRSTPPPDWRLSVDATNCRVAARARDLAPLLAELHDAGCQSLHALARTLTERGITTPRGGQWTAAAARTLLRQIADLDPPAPFSATASAFYWPEAPRTSW